jgi:hypothetical protein
VIDQPASPEPRRFEDFDKQQQDGKRDQQVAGGDLPLAAGNDADRGERRGPIEHAEDEGEDVVENEGDQQEGEANEKHGRLSSR